MKNLTEDKYLKFETHHRPYTGELEIQLIEYVKGPEDKFFKINDIVAIKKIKLINFLGHTKDSRQIADKVSKIIAEMIHRYKTRRSATHHLYVAVEERLDGRYVVNDSKLGHILMTRREPYDK